MSDVLRPAPRGRRPTRRLGWAVGLLLLIPLPLAACGGTSTTATTDQPSATSAPRTGGTDNTDDATGTTRGTRPGTTVDDDDTTTTTRRRSTTTTTEDEDTTTTTGPVAAGWADWCAVNAKYDVEFEDVDENDPAYLPRFKTAFQELTDAAPAEIAADMQTVNAFVQSITTYAQVLSPPPEVKAITEKFNDFEDTKCGKAI